METNLNKQLEELREKYRKGLVSVMVGAGFSRNACEKFPLWKDLLYDMVTELYSDEIESSFLRYKEINPDVKISLEYFTKEEASRIIERVGPLKIASEYIVRRGYREAIEYYIEERIPYIDTDSHKFKFAGKNAATEIDVDPDKFLAHKKLLEGFNWDRIYTTNYDRLLEYAMGFTGKKYKVITKAKDLSVSREIPSIIKLHGDLYYPKEKRVFMFDGNPHQQYIISEDDYKSYPEKHEAFTQLMRISLLQGVFCLIGFSGDDPNFINWLNWVRDILVTDDKVEGRHKYKIYLIGLSKDTPDAVRQIFYDNHNILYVPILSDEVKTLIDAKDVTEPRELFCRFFDFLYKTEDPESALTEDDLDRNGKSYTNLWATAYKVNREFKEPNRLDRNVVVNEEVLEKICSLKPWNRFASNLHYQTVYIQEIGYKEKFTKQEARLALLALKDLGIPISESLSQKISAAPIGEDDKLILNALSARSVTIGSSAFDESDSTDNVYEEVLRALYTLNFKRVKELLADWLPSGVDVVRKAYVLSFFDKEGAKILLVDYLGSKPNYKEQYFATKLLNVVEDTYPFIHSLDRFENANVQDYFDLLSKRIKAVHSEKGKIGPYGTGKHEKIQYIGGEPNKRPEALSVLDFLIEAPAFVCYRNFYSFISPENWYAVHKELYEYCPLPIMYYGLQCNDKKVKARIGQDFAYSEKLKDYIGELLSYLLEAYLSEDTPGFLKESIVIVAKELFVAVDSSKWDSLFMRVWDEVILKTRFDNTKNPLLGELDKFVYKGLNSLRKVSYRRQIIADVITNVKKDTTFAINCLYYLHVVPSDMKDDEELEQVVKVFLSGITTPSELNVAGNIHRLLTDEQKELCAEKCIKQLSRTDGKIEDIVYQASQFFVKDDPSRIAIFLKSVCESSLLWRNGLIGENTYSSDCSYLRVSGFMHRIYFNQDALICIYERLKQSFGEIQNYINRNHSTPIFSDFDGLLAEMLAFLNHFEERLVKQEDFQNIKDGIIAIYHETSGLRDTDDGLLSEYKEDLKKSLEYIHDNYRVIPSKTLNHYINIIINRVLLMNSDGLDYCIVYLWIFLNKGIIKKDNEEQMSGLIDVLERYKKENVLDCDMDLVWTGQYLEKIAKFLEKHGIVTAGTGYWKNFMKDSGLYTNWA